MNAFLESIKRFKHTVIEVVHDVFEALVLLTNQILHGHHYVLERDVCGA